MSPPVCDQFVSVVIRLIEGDARRGAHQTHAVAELEGKHPLFPEQVGDPLPVYDAVERGEIHSPEEWARSWVVGEDDAGVRAVPYIRQFFNNRTDRLEGFLHFFRLEREADRSVTSCLEGNVGIQPHESGIAEDPEARMSGLRCNLEGE